MISIKITETRYPLCGLTFGSFHKYIEYLINITLYVIMKAKQYNKNNNNNKQILLADLLDNDTVDHFLIS